LAAISQIPRDILDHAQDIDKMAEGRDIKTMRIPSENSCLKDVTGDSEGFFVCLMFLSVIWPRVMGGGREGEGRGLSVDLDNKPSVLEFSHDGGSQSICSSQIGS
jgi:hypothetical protein